MKKQIQILIALLALSFAAWGQSDRVKTVEVPDSLILIDISDSTFLGTIPSSSEILNMFPDDDKATYIYKQRVELNDRRSSIREDHGYNSAPSFFISKKGTLLTAYRRCKGHAGDGDVIVSRSENGITWNHITVLENPDPVSYGYYESVLADFNTDTIHLYTRYSNDTTGNSIDTAILVHSISVNDGESWTLIDTLPSFYNIQIVGPSKGIEYEGRRIIPFYAVAGVGSTAYVAGIMYTDDYGVTWDTSLYSQDTLLKLDESEIVLVGDTIVALIRSEEAGVQEQLFRTYSIDAGDTWAVPELTTISDWRRCHPGIIALPNGNMLLNGRRLSSPTRRPTMWQSSDNGRNWDTIGEIDSIGYSNYGSFELIGNSKVGLAYSVDNRYDGTSNDRSALKFAIFDVPGTVVFARSGSIVERVSEEDFSYDDPVRNEELWTSTRHYFDENVTVTVCKDSCDYLTINQAFAWASTQVAAFDSTIASPRITIYISRNEDGTAYEFSSGLFIPSGDWYPITITSNGDSILYTGASYAFRQYSRGMSPFFVNLRLYDFGTGTDGIQLLGANSYLDQLIVDGFTTGVYLSEGNHFLYRSTIKNCGTGLFLSRGYGYIRSDSIYNCSTGVSAQGGFVEFRDMRVLNNTTSVIGFLGATFSFNNSTQQFWSNGVSPSSSDFTFNANGGCIYRNAGDVIGGTSMPRNTWVNGNYIGGTEYNLMETSTVGEPDPNDIRIYYNTDLSEYRISRDGIYRQLVPKQSGTFYNETAQYTFPNFGTVDTILVDTLTDALVSNRIAQDTGYIRNISADTMRWQVSYSFFRDSDEDALTSFIDLTTDGTDSPEALLGSRAYSEQAAVQGTQHAGPTFTVDVPPGDAIRLCVYGAAPAAGVDISELTISVEEIYRE